MGGRVGHETGDWRGIHAPAKAALRRVEETVDRPHLLTRYRTILAGLEKYARRSGAAPHELIAIFGRQSAARGDDERAWETIEGAIARWWPCDAVLRTPRG